MRVQIGLERDQLEVEHQVDVVRVENGHARRLVDRRREPVMSFSAFSMRCSISRMDVEVFVELAAIVRAEVGGQLRGALVDQIEDAAAIQQAPRADFGRQARVDVAEQPLEDEARIGFRRHRRRGPRQARLLV